MNADTNRRGQMFIVETCTSSSSKTVGLILKEGPLYYDVF